MLNLPLSLSLSLPIDESYFAMALHLLDHVRASKLLEVSFSIKSKFMIYNMQLMYKHILV